MANWSNQQIALAAQGAFRFNRDECIRIMDNIQRRRLALNSNQKALAADSERCRSAFRSDGDHDSGIMPITIPR